tara:strand:- start:58552 stop:59028 length:477 start_codon:yes stop_codon:yes gene_type:complete
MASTVKTQTLKVTLTEEIVLNGSNYKSSNVLSIPLIAEISKRIVSVTTTEAQILAFGSAVANGTYVLGNVKYIRITNLDDANHVVITLVNSIEGEAALKLDYGQSMIINGDLSGGLASVMIADNTAITNPHSSLANLASINAIADTSAVDLEIFVACV